ncbi:hypothetical protein FB451DRAFT_1404394 [Mycena latifolia]|nr:hypothetical protein FB451DRAFT_1404394 [Mycena latifolia]
MRGDETCERAAVALLAGMLVPSVVRLHFLLAVSTYYAHLVAPAPGATAAGSATALHPPNVCAADVVHAPRAARSSAARRCGSVHARARRGGCSMRAWYTASASGSEGPVLVAILLPTRLPPSPFVSVSPGRYPNAVLCTYPAHRLPVPFPSLPPSSSPTYLRPLPPVLTYVPPSLTLVLFS